MHDVFYLFGNNGLTNLREDIHFPQIDPLKTYSRYVLFEWRQGLRHPSSTSKRAEIEGRQNY
jgi:hypothetical protein